MRKPFAHSGPRHDLVASLNQQVARSSPASGPQFKINNLEAYAVRAFVLLPAVLFSPSVTATYCLQCLPLLAWPSLQCPDFRTVLSGPPPALAFAGGKL